MPLVGEQAGSAWAYEIGGDQYSASWDIDIPPSAAFIKVSLGKYFEFDDQSNVEVGLMNIRFRDPEGVDRTIDFGSVDSFNPTLVQFNQTMTHVTFGMIVSNVSGALLWTLGFWE